MPTKRGRPRGLVPGSRSEQLLAVARSLPQPFTPEDLAVAAWQACPQLFGMAGHPYPDLLRVSGMLHGVCGLVYRGYVERQYGEPFDGPPLFRVAKGKGK